MHSHDHTPITVPEEAPSYYGVMETSIRELLPESEILKPDWRRSDDDLMGNPVVRGWTVSMALTKVRTRSYAVIGVLLLAVPVWTSAQTPPDLSQQIAAVMREGASGEAHLRYVHAKGIVCQGSFQPSSAAAEISRAAHFAGGEVPVTLRFSDGASDLTVADNSPDAAPQGMAIRFEVGHGTDIMAISHNGFVVGNGEDFLELQKAIFATDHSKPHPWPIEVFLMGHPRALKFVQDLGPIPASFAVESYYSNNALVFVDKNGHKQAGRYQIIPESGSQNLDDASAKAASADFLFDELRHRLTTGPARFHLLLQLADPGDQTNDGSIVWPGDRQKVELGVITVSSIVPDSAKAERALAFDPTRLIDGIELSDDPLPALRSRVYAYSVAGRSGR